MESNLSLVQPELIISHIWSTRSKARLAVMQQSLDALLKDLGNPKIVPNDRQVISDLIEGRARWFSMGCNGYAVSIAEKYLDFNFADLVFIVGLAYNVLADIQHRYTENLIKKYLSFIITIQTAIYKSIKNSILVVSVSRERSCSAAFFAVFQA